MANDVFDVQNTTLHLCSEVILCDWMDRWLILHRQGFLGRLMVNLCGY